MNKKFTCPLDCGIESFAHTHPDGDKGKVEATGKDLMERPKGQTHYMQDGCGDSAHNYRMTQIDDILKEFEKKFVDSPRSTWRQPVDLWNVYAFLRSALLSIRFSTLREVEEAMGEEKKQKTFIVFPNPYDNEALSEDIGEVKGYNAHRSESLARIKKLEGEKE